jgi:hypothetical protein
MSEAHPSETIPDERGNLKEVNTIVSELSDEAMVKLEVIQSLMEAGDRATYAQRLEEAAEKLGKSVRTVRRLVDKWEEQGLLGLVQSASSEVVALALRDAILLKQYGTEYGLHCEWGTYRKPEHFYTDGGKDFRSNHLQQIGGQLGFVCHLRVGDSRGVSHRPSEGGIVERPFGTFNTELFSTLPGYTGSNVQKRPEDAEKDACLTLRLLPPAGVGMKLEPIRLCGACYAESPCHKIEWQFKTTVGCDRHGLRWL